MGVTSKCVGDRERRHEKGQTKGEERTRLPPPGPGRGPAGARAAPPDPSDDRGRQPPVGLRCWAGPGEAAPARRPLRSPRRNRPPPAASPHRSEDHLNLKLKDAFKKKAVCKKCWAALHRETVAVMCGGLLL
ncbi:uncharacterized protein FN964_001056 isoform 1-T1 [Alca torda]